MTISINKENQQTFEVRLLIRLCGRAWQKGEGQRAGLALLRAASCRGTEPGMEPAALSRNPLCPDADSEV